MKQLIATIIALGVAACSNADSERADPLTIPPRGPQYEFVIVDSCGIKVRGPVEATELSGAAFTRQGFSSAEIDSILDDGGPKISVGDPPRDTKREKKNK